MKWMIFVQAALVVASVLLSGCNQKMTADPRLAEPPPTVVQSERDASRVKVEHPERFPLATVIAHATPPLLNVTGVVGANVAPSGPGVSRAAARLGKIHAGWVEKVS